jgi:hypothetical protein
VAVAIGGRVDDDLQAFLAERADISGRCGGHAASGDIAEFGGIIGREKDVMMVEIEALGLGVRQPDHCRERTRFFGHVARSGGRRAAQQSRCESRRVAIEDDFASGQSLATLQFNSGYDFILNGNAGDRLTIKKHHALFLGEPLQRIRQRAHPALDCPHTLRLDMSDQHQSGGRLEWGRPAIGRVTSKQLPQARVGEILAQRRP